MKLENHVVLITGGGSGIGLALARGFLERKNTVIAAGRRAARLAQAKEANPGLHVIECDVTDEAQTRAALDRIQRDYGRLSILVNNAGIANNMNVVKGVDPKMVDHEVATNLLAPIKLTLSALPALLREPAAAVVNVTSGVAYAPVAQLAVYSATKTALHSFGKSLRHQLERTSVKVFEILPPTTETEINRNQSGKKAPADSVAQAALRAIEKDQFEIAIGESKFLQVMMRIAPGLIAPRILRVEY